MGSELHRFGFTGDGDDERWKAAVEKFLAAILTNPHLNIGSANSEIVFPPQSPVGRAGVAASSTTTGGGAFFTKRTVESEDADNGDIYLQGGQVSGWGTPVDEIKIYDASTTSWQGSVGDVLKMTVTGTGAETSGILDPSFTPTGVSVPASSATLGTNTFPVSGDLTGKVCQISLGTFFGTGATVEGFQPALPGNIQIAFCWSGYAISRF